MKKSQLRNIIRESIKGLITEQANYDCSNRLCSPSGPNMVNWHWRDYFSIAANGHQNSNFAKYRYEHTGNISFCQSTSGPGNQWRWFDGIKLNPATNVNSGPGPIGPNPIHPNWASMITYLQGQGVAVTLADTGLVVDAAAVQALKTSGIISTPQGACGNQPCPPPCNPVNDERGCMDSNALNYNECCDLTDPNCVPNISTPDCCKYEGGEPCDKCCCKKGDHLPMGEKCAPGTISQLSQTANPCECPQGTIETPCKPTGPTLPNNPIGSLQERFQKLANIK